MARVDCGRLRRLVDERYLTVREHPNGGLLIWDYAPQTVFARYWTPETLMCRGLITTPDGEVVARPFPKFFNLEELDAPLPDEPYDVFEKLDGSLGILYRHPAAPDRPAIATRGSFASGQALRATELLRGAPEEFADWIQAVADELTQAYEAIEATCRSEFRPYGDRRETAAYFQTCSYPPVLFRMLDGKPYAPLIWRALYPDAAQPYARVEQ